LRLAFEPVSLLVPHVLPLLAVSLLV